MNPVVCILRVVKGELGCRCEMLVPVVLREVDHTAQHDLERLVRVLGLPVRLRDDTPCPCSASYPMLVQKARQKCAVKRGSRSLTMRSGMPWCRTTVAEE